MILKIYLIIVWLIGIVIGLFAKNNWNEINHDGKYDMLNPQIIIPIIVVFFPIIMPIIIIKTIIEEITTKKYDN